MLQTLQMRQSNTKFQMGVDTDSITVILQESEENTTQSSYSLATIS